MFEDSLMESQNRLSSPNRRWTTVLSLTLQCSLAAAIIAASLIHTDTLAFHIDSPKIMLPTKPLPRPVPHLEATTAAASSASAPVNNQPATNRRIIPTSTPDSSDAPPTTTPIGTGMGDPNSMPSALGTSISGTGPRVSVASASATPKGIMHVSTGVLAGLLLSPILPIYPRIAIATRTEGIVKVEAIISKSGSIESAHVVSGPAVLRQAALDAIRNARYTPYLLNGSPTEVETTITVNFKLSS